MSQERDTVRKLMTAINRIDGLWYRLARRSRVKVNTLSLLFALDDGIPRTQKQICEEWIIPKTTLNTVVKECAAEGYVTLAHDRNAKDKLVSLTPKGVEYARRSLRLFYEAEDAAMEETLSLFSPEFVDAIAAYAEHLKRAVETGSQTSEK